MTTLLLDIKAAKKVATIEEELALVAEWQRREGISYARRESIARKLARVLRIRRRAR